MPRECAVIKTLATLLVAMCWAANASAHGGGQVANGQGVPQDYVQAHKWFNLAASTLSGSDGAEAVKNRDVAAARMTPAQIAEAQKLARECVKKKFKDC